MYKGAGIRLDHRLTAGEAWKVTTLQPAYFFLFLCSSFKIKEMQLLMHNLI